jgi:hypothetical protein
MRCEAAPVAGSGFRIQGSGFRVAPFGRELAPTSRGSVQGSGLPDASRRPSSPGHSIFENSF